MCVYVNGKEYINIEDDSLINTDGYVGVRGWKADVEYTSVQKKYRFKNIFNQFSDNSLFQKGDTVDVSPFLRNNTKSI